MLDKNDKTLAQNKAELILLIDSNAYIDIQKLAKPTGEHPLNFLKRYGNIDYYFSKGAAEEIVLSEHGIDANAFNIMQRTLEEEQIYLQPDDTRRRKDNVYLYNSRDGQIKSIQLNVTSETDRGQILLAQNHHQLVLLTTDKKMLKAAAPLLDRRLIDLQGFLELLTLTENPYLKEYWQATLEEYMETSRYVRPSQFKYIPDRLPGPVPKHLEQF